MVSTYLRDSFAESSESLIHQPIKPSPNSGRLYSTPLFVSNVAYSFPLLISVTLNSFAPSVFSTYFAYNVVFPVIASTPKLNFCVNSASLYHQTNMLFANSGSAGLDIVPPL